MNINPRSCVSLCTLHARKKWINSKSSDFHLWLNSMQDLISATKVSNTNVLDHLKATMRCEWWRSLISCLSVFRKFYVALPVGISRCLFICECRCWENRDLYLLRNTTKGSSIGWWPSRWLWWWWVVSSWSSFWLRWEHGYFLYSWRHIRECFGPRNLFTTTPCGMLLSRRGKLWSTAPSSI